MNLLLNTIITIYLLYQICNKPLYMEFPSQIFINLLYEWRSKEVLRDKPHSTIEPIAKQMISGIQDQDFNLSK